MAQTKTRKSRSSNASGRSQKASSSGRGNSTSRSKSSSAKSRSRGTTRKSGATTQRSRKPAAAGNGQPDSRLGTILEKVKSPAMAGGAALVGLAGGLALTRRRNRNGVLGKLRPSKLKPPKLKTPTLKMPKPDAAAKAVGDAAGQVAEQSRRVNEVASEVKKASDAIAKR